VGRPAQSRGALAGLRSGGRRGALAGSCGESVTRLSSGIAGNPDAQQEGHSRGSGSLPPVARSFFSVLAPWQLTGMAPTLIWQARKGQHGRVCPHQREERGRRGRSRVVG
jgi:hypothetical protein